MEFNSWICFVLELCLLGMPLQPFSEECVAKVVYRVLLFYLVVSSALAILVAARMRRELCSSTDLIAINFRLELLASIVFNNNHGRSVLTIFLSFL